MSARSVIVMLALVLECGSVATAAAQSRPIAPVGRLTVEAFHALAAEEQQAYAMGLADGLPVRMWMTYPSGRAEGMTRLLRIPDVNCFANLSAVQLNETIVSAIAKEPASGALARSLAESALLTACPRSGNASLPPSQNDKSPLGSLVERARSSVRTFRLLEGNVDRETFSGMSDHEHRGYANGMVDALLAPWSFGMYGAFGFRTSCIAGLTDERVTEIVVAAGPHAPSTVAAALVRACR